MKGEAMHKGRLSDADLVTDSLGGDRDAFGQIAERYQDVIASVANANYLEHQATRNRRV
jgi:hypothetical protein